ncbi:MAG TPA: zf-HC2 domain-containing protein [Gaiellaceae bacterium]|jgi:predicted anti-sigma-YlaC factor YlaD|nr:zf-HC2 domain-containing protein [Gaiellaceae bacterium]
MGVVLTPECERAHALASLALDGELTEVEQARLRAHVAHCVACAGFARDVDVLTRELRAAPLTRPAVVGMPKRRRSTGMRSFQVLAAAAAVVCAAGLGSLAGSLHSSPSPVFISATTGTLSGATADAATVARERVPGGRVVDRLVAL